MSDNYIDIVPGVEYKTKILDKGGDKTEAEELLKDIKFRSYRQVY
jgi:hypothetical protein